MGGRVGTLRLIDALLEGLAANRIQYVHWKSNEHLEPALRGETDLDLLVLGEHRDPFEKVLTGLSFVPLASAPARRIPGTASYLGFDPTTGALVHLDVQYRLVLGEQLLKNHHLPVEDWLLDDPSNLGGVRVPKPEQEMLLLYVRAMLKTTNRQLLAARVKGGSPVPQRIVKEARWLAERTDPASLDAAANSSGLEVGGDELAEFRTRVVGGSPGPRLRRLATRLPSEADGPLPQDAGLHGAAQEGDAPPPFPTLGSLTPHRHPQAPADRQGPAGGRGRRRRVRKEPPHPGPGILVGLEGRGAPRLLRPAQGRDPLQGPEQAGEPGPSPRELRSLGGRSLAIPTH